MKITRILNAMLQDAIGAEAVEPGNGEAGPSDVQVDPEQRAVAGIGRVEPEDLQFFFTAARGIWAGLDANAIEPFVIVPFRRIKPKAVRRACGAPFDPWKAFVKASCVRRIA